MDENITEQLQRLPKCILVLLEFHLNNPFPFPLGEAIVLGYRATQKMGLPSNHLSLLDIDKAEAVSTSSEQLTYQTATTVRLHLIFFASTNSYPPFYFQSYYVIKTTIDETLSLLNTNTRGWRKGIRQECDKHRPNRSPPGLSLTTRCLRLFWGSPVLNQESRALEPSSISPSGPLSLLDDAVI